MSGDTKQDATLASGRASVALPAAPPPLANTRERYGAVAVLLHWSMAVLVIGLLALGLYMVTLPDAGFTAKKIVLILYHKQIGLMVLVLLLARWAWRVTHLLPQLAEHLPEWQQIAARVVHLCFYALLLALPISGWLMSSAAGIPVTFLGLTLPDLIGRNDDRFALFIQIHKWLAYTLIALIAVHMGAALRHHFALKDDTLRKMLP